MLLRQSARFTAYLECDRRWLASSETGEGDAAITHLRKTYIARLTGDMQDPWFKGFITDHKSKLGGEKWESEPLSRAAAV